MVEEQIGIAILKEYNKLLGQNPLYEQHFRALDNWDMLRSQVTGLCTKCGKKSKTHLHHKNKTLKPKNLRTIPLEIIYVPAKDIIYLNPYQIIKNYLNKFEVKKTIKYFNVKYSDVIELCPQCHRKEHRGI